MNILKIISAVVFFCVLTSACTTNSDLCLSTIISRNAAWVEVLLDDCALSCCTCRTHLYRGVYDNQNIYFTETSGPLCDIIQTIALRDCNGDVIKTYEGAERSQFHIEVTERELLIQCE